MTIELDDLSRPEVNALLSEHLRNMHALSPPESVHALDLEALRRRGAGRAILAHILEVARSRGYQRLSLETGANEAFEPAHELYERFGFAYCGPFGEYVEDSNARFMTMRLNG